jgi:hypothetical protein
MAKIFSIFALFELFELLSEKLFNKLNVKKKFLKGASFRLFDSESSHCV